MDVLIEFVPSIGALILFVILIRTVLRADRSEREAEREFIEEINAENEKIDADDGVNTSDATMANSVDSSEPANAGDSGSVDSPDNASKG